MKKVFVGHRGVGKTELLQRHKRYFPHVVHFDLDHEIENALGKSVTEIFTERGEDFFRQAEIQTYKKLITENASYVISLGAGFNLNEIANSDHIVFVSRVTDKHGRIFQNRPRLAAGFALEEYESKYTERQPQYLSKAHSIYHMPEGIQEACNFEKNILSESFQITDAIYTLTKNEVKTVHSLKKNFARIELRSDLIAMSEIHKLVQEDPKYRWLVSIRTAELPPPGVIDVDFDIQFKPTNFEGIVSSHEDSIEKALDAVKSIERSHLKLAPLVENFEDLLIGHSWQQQDPSNRSFLPRSSIGKWFWYRQLAKYWQEINFVRGLTDLSDQPSVYQWLTLPLKKPDFFAAVVGKPVLFSRSPQFHQKFFAQKNSFFTAIEISETEFSKYLGQLIDFGLKYAAVTSPLKKIAFLIADKPTALAEHFHSANTMVIDDEIVTENTDLHGFESVIDSQAITEQIKIAVWGGGGTLEMMKFILPQAQFFPARSYTAAANSFRPDVVIWAAPRLSDTLFPPESWQPKAVLDLNYVENSMGLEYAQKKNCSYVSGLGMFKAQALEQQKYWSLR